LLLRHLAPDKSSAEMPFANCSAMTFTFPTCSRGMHLHVHLTETY
jgi:hypothetical protein